MQPRFYAQAPRSSSRSRSGYGGGQQYPQGGGGGYGNSQYGGGGGGGYNYNRQPQMQMPQPGFAPPNLQQIFAQVDTNRTGNINHEELQRALSNGSWRPFNPETVRLMIGMFDQDFDQSINFQEFENLWNYVNQWTDCFRMFDRDNSGNIDRGELANAMTRFGYRLSGRFYDFMIRRFDRTRTGRISFDDFVQLCVVLQTITATFRDEDHDRDGVITIHYEQYLTMVAGLMVTKMY